MNLIQRLMMPDCHRVRKVLQSYLDGELDDRHAGMVAAHLDQCDRCGIEAELYEQVRASLQRLRSAPDPDALARLRQFADAVPAAVPDGHEDPQSD